MKSLPKAGKLGKSGEKSALEERRSKAFDKRQQQILNDGASDAEYHYIGSPKIFGGIGKGFAESLLELVGKGK